MKGQIVITVVMLYAVNIVRADSFSKRETQRALTLPVRAEDGASRRSHVQMFATWDDAVDSTCYTIDTSHAGHLVMTRSPDPPKIAQTAVLRLVADLP